MPRSTRRTARLSLETLEDRCVLASGFRTFDGTGNNLLHEDWGSAGSQLIRIAPAAYAHGVSAPAGDEAEGQDGRHHLRGDRPVEGERLLPESLPGLETHDGSLRTRSSGPLR